MTPLFRPALTFLVLFTLLLGVGYPALLTLAAHTFFPTEAEGNIINTNGKISGSRLIGQSFSDPKYFWGRPSATERFDYNAAASSASNLSPGNPALIEAVQQRIDALKTADPKNTAPIPIDLVTSSGSGLDPHITPAAALYQVPRIAKARNMPEEALRDLIARHTEKRTLGFLGEERINVLILNRTMDGINDFPN